MWWHLARSLESCSTDTNGCPDLPSHVMDPRPPLTTAWKHPVAERETLLEGQVLGAVSISAEDCGDLRVPSAAALRCPDSQWFWGLRTGWDQNSLQCERLCPEPLSTPQRGHHCWACPSCGGDRRPFPKGQVAPFDIPDVLSEVSRDLCHVSHKTFCSCQRMSPITQFTTRCSWLKINPSL